MARRTSVTETPHAAGTSYPVQLGAHNAGDLLLVCVSNDQPGAGTTIVADTATAAAGWTLVGTQASSQATRQVWFWVIATSDAMANPVFTVQNTGTTGTCLVYKEHNGIGGVMRSDWGNSTNINSAASNTVAYSSAGGTTVITPAADSLMLYSWGCDGTGNYMRTKLNDLICDSRRAVTGVVGDVVSHVIGHVQLNSASCPNVTMYASTATEGGNGWVIEVKNAASGTKQKQVRADVDETGNASNWYGSLGAQHKPVTWNKPSTFVAAAGGVQTVTINGVAITLSDTALGTVSTSLLPSDSPWGTPSSIPNTDNANVLAGAWHTITSSNLDGKIFSFQWDVAVSSASGRINTEGVIIGFASSDGNYAMYQVCTKAIGWLASQVRTAIIDLNNATLIASGSTGAGIDWTAITRVGYFWHRASGSASSDSLEIKNACILNSAAITGGSAIDPANFQVAASDLVSWGHKLICEQQGSAQVLCKFPIQMCDGTNYTYFDSSASSVEFPKAFSATQKDWNVNANKVSVTILAKLGDTVIMAAGVAASETAQALNISASSAAFADATYSFVGESIVGMTPTDNKGLNWANATFKSGGVVTIAGGGDLTNCSISKTTSTNAALSISADGSVLTGDTIDVTGTSAAYHLELGASVTAITLEDVTFSGAPGTNKVHVLDSNGAHTVTIMISGSTVLDAGGVTSAGAAVSVVAPTVTAAISVTGMSNTVGANNRLQIINSTAVAAASRANSTAYAAGDIRLRQTGIGSENTAGLYLRCTTSGTSAGTPPTWNTTPGGTTTDGTVVWTTYKVLFYDADPASTSYSTTYIDGKEFLTGETVEVRFAEEDPAVSFKTYSTSVIAASTGFSALANSTNDSVYATYALSGAAQDSIFSPNFVANYIVLDANINFAGSSAYAYYCYLLTTSDGMYRFWGGLTGIDPGNIRNNVSVISLYFDETAGFVRQTDDVRIFRSDGARPALDPTTGGAGIEINWKVPVNVVTTGGSALTTDEHNALMGLPSAAVIANEVVNVVTFP